MTNGPDAGADRVIALDGAYNVRDLGGLATEQGGRTTSGLIYRGDGLGALTPADHALLTGQLGLTTIIDLRTSEEAGGDGLEDQRLFPELTVYHLSVIPEGRIGREPFPSDDPAQLAARYLENLVEGSDVLAEAVTVLARSAAEGRPALFHCAAGRDRTGMLSALTLDVVGARRAEIVADYVASNLRSADVARRMRANPLYANDEADKKGSLLLRPETIDTFLDLVNAQLGGTRAWAIGAGVDADLLDELTKALADGSTTPA
jgi:protein-tyrosine phosphatase